MYHYITIGAGSAGCVLAHRLTEDPQINVLLLEAGGPDKRREIHIPAAFNKLFKTGCDWAYETEEQPHLYYRKIFWPRGRVLGGTSSINAMIYSRANAKDHDRWAEVGVTGWSYRDVLPYYKKSEHNERGANEFHGVGGPLNVTDLRCVNPLSHLFVEAATKVGFPYNADFNGARQEGVGFFQVTQKDGKRHSTAVAFLKPALRRPNLTVKTYAHVTRLLFENHRAIGAEFVQNGQTEQARAKGGVILCGGVINTPQVLMLSGIGPADHLRALGIPVVADLPGVGQNLQDHPLIDVEYQCNEPVTLYKADNFKNILNYLLFKKGPLTSNLAEAGGFIKTRAGLNMPDIELIFAPTLYLESGFKNPELHGFAVGVVLQHPESRGEMRLRSRDPFAAPVIQPNYFAAESDMVAVVKGVKVAREIVRAKSFDPFRSQEWWPRAYRKDDAGIAEHVRRTSKTCYHPVGTCPMGRGKLSVVDERLQVHGLEGLRIVDASVIPLQTTGHTNAPVIMMAERAADLIKAERKGNR
jgi:choline dehydrogenase